MLVFSVGVMQLRGGLNYFDFLSLLKIILFLASCYFFLSKVLYATFFNNIAFGGVYNFASILVMLALFLALCSRILC